MTEVTASESELPASLTCIRVVDEAEEIVCGNPGLEEVLVRNRFGLFAVLLCAQCKTEHTEFYKQKRAAKSHAPDGNTRRRITQSRGSMV